jgi:hypothetical protein
VPLFERAKSAGELNLVQEPERRAGFSVAEAAIPQDNRNLAAVKGPACDIRHRVAVSAVYEIPALKTNAWAGGITAAFAAPAAFTYGNVGRNTVYGPTLSKR